MKEEGHGILAQVSLVSALYPSETSPKERGPHIITIESPTGSSPRFCQTKGKASVSQTAGKEKKKKKVPEENRVMQLRIQLAPDFMKSNKLSCCADRWYSLAWPSFLFFSFFLSSSPFLPFPELFSFSHYSFGLGIVWFVMKVA